MFERTSRYYDIETAQLRAIDRDGNPQAIPYKRRRFIPPATESILLVEHTVMEGDRLDNITARYLDDPTQFWQVCDANNAMRPEELEQRGRVVRIALPDR